MEMEPLCPSCRVAMVLKWSETYRHKNGDPKFFFQCVNHPKCRNTHGAHPGGTPLGTPADKETRRARQRLHHLLDQVWPFSTQDGKAKMYHWLATMAPKKHVGDMTIEECSQTALLILTQYRDRLKKQERRRLKGNQ